VRQWVISFPKRLRLDGIDNGPAEPFDFDEFIDEKESELKGA